MAEKLDDSCNVEALENLAPKVTADQAVAKKEQTQLIKSHKEQDHDSAGHFEA